jgi:hypothetical protein
MGYFSGTDSPYATDYSAEQLRQLKSIPYGTNLGDIGGLENLWGGQQLGTEASFMENPLLTPKYRMGTSGGAYRGEGTQELMGDPLIQQQQRDLLTSQGLDPNAQYMQGQFKAEGGPSNQDMSRVLYQLQNNNWVPVQGLGYRRRDTGTALREGVINSGKMLAAVIGSGQAYAAAGGGTGLTAGTEAATTSSQIGGQGLTSAQANALYGTEGYGAGMTGAETAAYDAAIKSGMTAGEALDYVRKGYNYYNKGKNILGLLSGGGEQPAPQAPQGSGLSGFTPVSHSLNLGNPRLGAAQAQEKAFTEQSYAPVAQEEQRRRLKGLLRQDYV